MGSAAPRSGRLAGAVAVAALFAGPVASGAAVGLTEEDLLGAWHVLVHYTDERSARPDAMRWDDRIWVFERSGNRLRWIEYPIVVFEDSSGRFEHLGTNRASRVVHAWEPNPGQLAQIQSGLEINHRGKKSKSLRPSRNGFGWSSTSSASPASASVITYVEHWRIEGTAEAPVFEREDQLGSARTESLDGITRYTTTSIEDGVLRGAFERDGTRHGTFRMMRAGGVRTVEGSGKTQGERLQEMWMSQFGAGLVGGQSGRFLREEVERRLESGEMKISDLPEEAQEEIRIEIRGEIRRAIEDHLRSQEIDPRQARPQIESLTRQIEKLIVDEGRSVDEVGQMLREGVIRP